MPQGLNRVECSHCICITVIFPNLPWENSQGGMVAKHPVINPLTGCHLFIAANQDWDSYLHLNSDDCGPVKCKQQLGPWTSTRERACGHHLRLMPWYPDTLMPACPTSVNTIPSAAAAHRIFSYYLPLISGKAHILFIHIIWVGVMVCVIAVL